VDGLGARLSVTPCMQSSANRQRTPVGYRQCHLLPLGRAWPLSESCGL